MGSVNHETGKLAKSFIGPDPRQLFLEKKREALASGAQSGEGFSSIREAATTLGGNVWGLSSPNTEIE